MTGPIALTLGAMCLTAALCVPLLMRAWKDANHG